MAVLAPPRPLYSSTASASANVPAYAPRVFPQVRQARSGPAMAAPGLSPEEYEEELRRLVARARAGDEQARQQLLEMQKPEVGGGLVRIAQRALTALPVLRDVPRGAGVTTGAIGAGMTAPQSPTGYTASSRREEPFRAAGETAAGFVFPTSPLDVAFTIGPGKLLKPFTKGLGRGLGPVVARAVPESDETLEALLKQSLDLAKTDPAAARKVFGAEAGEAAAERAGNVSASSQYFRDRGHLRKRAAAMTTAMNEQAEFQKLKTELTEMGIDVSGAQTAEEAQAIARAWLDNPPSPGPGLLPEGGVGRLTPGQTAVRTGAAGLVGGTTAGVGAELDQNPETGFAEAFPAGALAGATSGVGLRLPGAGVNPVTPQAPPAQQPDTRSFARRALDELGAIPGALKRQQTSSDVLGAVTRQSLPVLFTNPAMALRNAGRAARAYFDPKVLDEVEALPGFREDRLFRNGVEVQAPKRLPGFNPVTGQMQQQAPLPRDTIRVKSMAEELGIGKDFAVPGFERGTEKTWVDRLPELNPLMGASERSAKVNLVANATELRNAFVENALRAGVKDQSWYDLYGTLAKTRVGYGKVPEMLKGISTNFYSLRNLAARFQTVTQPFTMPGPMFDVGRGSIFSASPRGVATQGLFRFAAGELANLRALAYVGQQTGLFEVGYNPLEPGFGKVTHTDENGNDITMDLMGGYGSLVQATARTAAWAKDKNEGKTSKFDPAAEWIKFMRYKMTSTSSAVVDTAIANTFLGRNPEDAQYEKNLADPETWKSGALLEDLLPFFAADTAQKLIAGDLPLTPEGLAQEGGLLLGQWAGLPLSSTEASAYDAVDAQVRKDVAAGKLPATWDDKSGRQQPVETYQNLRAASPEAAENWDLANPELVKNRNAATTREPTKLARGEQDQLLSRQAVRDAELLAKKPDQWRAESSADAQRTGAIIEGIYKSSGEYDREPVSFLDVVNQAYHTAIEANTSPSGKVDWDKVDRVVSAMPPKAQQLLFENRLRGETEPRKRYIRDLRQLEGYFQVRDAAWEDMRARNATLAEYASFDDFKQSIVDRIRAKGVGFNQAESMASSTVSSISEALSLQTTAYLAKHKELVPILDRWGFFVPSLLQPLTYQRP